MSLRRQLGVSFLVQGGGAASILLATLWLGASLGPEVQGGFSRTKSEIEFLAAFAMFGLPQALFFYLKSGRLSGAVALRWAAASALLAVPIAAVYARVEHAQAGLQAAAGIALAVGLSVLHGQWRAMLLLHARTIWFNLASALPQVVVLVGVGAAIALGDAPGAATWTAVFAASAGITAVLVCPPLRLALRPRHATDTPVTWRALGHYGLAAWLNAALVTAAILAMQHWVEAAQGRVALGQFTMAMTLVQVPLTPITYAAPLLFRRWMEQPGAHDSRRWAAMLYGALLLLAGAIALAALRWPDLGLGVAYDGATAALAVLALGGAAEAASRILTVQASASGRPWIAVRAEATRWSVLGIGWLGLSGGTGVGLRALCAVWALGATAAAATYAWHGRAA